MESTAREQHQGPVAPPDRRSLAPAIPASRDFAEALWRCALTEGARVVASEVTTSTRRLWLRTDVGRSAGALTPAQVRVLALAVRAYSDKEIAFALELPQGTVSSHLHHALRRLALTRRIEAIRCLGTRSSPPTSAADASAWLPLPAGASARPVRAGLAAVTLPRPSPTLPETLTPAERAVARALFDDQTNRAIARERAVSVRTVGHQIESIFRKLGIAARAELVLLLRGSPGGPRSAELR